LTVFWLYFSNLKNDLRKSSEIEEAKKEMFCEYHIGIVRVIRILVYFSYNELRSDLSMSKNVDFKTSIFLKSQVCENECEYLRILFYRKRNFQSFLNIKIRNNQIINHRRNDFEGENKCG
jgi:hypothetical protein